MLALPYTSATASNECAQALVFSSVKQALRAPCSPWTFIMCTGKRMSFFGSKPVSTIVFSFFRPYKVKSHSIPFRQKPFSTEALAFRVHLQNYPLRGIPIHLLR